jgi:hypothetical protein
LTAAFSSLLRAAGGIVRSAKSAPSLEEPSKEEEPPSEEPRTIEGDVEDSSDPEAYS